MDDSPGLAEDLENWMDQLPEPLKAMPVVHLSIPGSHDSGSCTITPSAAVSPDSLPVVRRLAAVFGCLVKRYVYRWSVTQRLSVLQQLTNGIRYLDLRVSTKQEEKELYVVHGMYGATVCSVLDEVNGFLLQRPGEVVILDLQHFYQLSPEQHSALMALISRIFGTRLCPVTPTLHSITLRWLRDHNHQVIVVYRSSAAQGNPSFWPSGSWPSPWPETTSVPTMLAFLEDKIAARPANSGLVTQCVLTPDIRFVLLHLLSDLQRSLSQVCTAAIQPWLQQQSPGPKGVNVVIYDFVSSTCSVARTIISLNSKLLAPNVKA